MEGEQPKRSTEIIEAYFDFLDRHIEEVISGKATAFMELGQIAQELAISHGHLSDTVRKIKGKHPCYFYDAKIIDRARQMLLETDGSIAHIAMVLTYDPSNFSKFFKKWTGETPGNFRKNHRNSP
ncbi:helix-turn-helix domain-containing protein [Arachidicoccus terrestris]|uniref:helix-turn-helix domain-containing protein n=1 Tax=Arachidicoccus terrestris TaxID=2875539 RepID=UPI001CC6CDDB|nr:AraC family transcriptional regulator [Arachidicoccus terrestris]UAY56140.1 AraC family transcriptional regulator [Arachidicoccus terrestris]